MSRMPLTKEENNLQYEIPSLYSGRGAPQYIFVKRFSIKILKKDTSVDPC